MPVTLFRVWRPEGYADIEAAIGAIAEAADLDFKRQLSKPTDIAKDIAAMSIQGGVIAYGIDEAAQTATASAITPIPLHQVPEKIQNIVDTAIWPSPAIDIQVFTKQQGDADGVVLVTVHASLLAPHYSHDRFPARSGTTTRNLTEREIAALYDQRRAALAPVEGPDILGRHVDPANAPGGIRGIGILRLVVAPLAPVGHPRGVHLARPLAAAVKSAEECLAWLTHSHFANAFDFLKEWTPRGTIGWQAGQTSDNFETLRRARTVAAICKHDLSLSFFATLGLEGADGQGFCANEQIWTAESLAFLSIAGHFFREVPGAAILRAGLRLQGLDGAASNAISRGIAFHDNQPRAADSNYLEQTQTSAGEAAVEPVLVARRLLDRLLVSFVPEEADTFLRLQSTV
jgi:hypothetical protein